MFLKAPGVCKFRLRCTRLKSKIGCEFTHKLPKHLHIVFQAKDTFWISHTDYKRYNRQYLRALKDLKEDCAECRKGLAEQKKPGQEYQVNLHPVVEFDLREKITREEENSDEPERVLRLSEKDRESDILQLSLSSEDADFFAERTEAESSDNQKLKIQKRVGCLPVDTIRSFQTARIEEEDEEGDSPQKQNHEETRLPMHLRIGSSENQELRIQRRVECSKPGSVDTNGSFSTALIAEEEEEELDSFNEQSLDRPRLPVHHRLPVHLRIGTRASWSSSSASLTADLSDDEEEAERDTTNDPFGDMMETVTNELTDFLRSQPDNECRMSDIHWFERISTYQPKHFGNNTRWIDLLETVEAVAVVGEGKNKILCLQPEWWRR